MATLIGSIIVFMLVIMLHELGHFTVAKLVGIKVNEFSIGMGPKLIQKEKGETKYSIRALPIGGYVAMEGEEESSDDPRSFENVSIPKKMAVVLAGAFMNFVLAIVAFFFVALLLGSSTTNVGVVIENSPAYIAGVQKDDKILSVNDKEIKSWQETIEEISSTKNGEIIKLELNRNGEKITKEITPELKDGVPTVGIGTKLEKSVSKSILSAFQMTWYIVISIIDVFKLIFSGNFNMQLLSGPVGVISQIGKETAKGIVYLINILGIISANLGVVNLLPIPALDGGKFLFLLIEAITGKKINEKFETTISLIGFSFLIGLMLYVTIFGDLARIISR